MSIYFVCFCSGPALGSVLYQVGGFLLPFMCVGIWCFIGAFGVLFTIPKVDMSIDLNAVDGKKLNILDLLKVSYLYLKSFIDYLPTVVLKR